MALTRLTFRNLIVNNTGFKRTDKDTEIYQALDETLDELCTVYEFQKYETRNTITLTNATRSYSITSNTSIFLKDITYVKSNSESWQLNKISRDEFMSKYDSIDASTPPQEGDPVDYMVFGDQIYLGPILNTVDATTTEKLDVHLVTVQTRLTSDGDTWSFDTWWDALIKHGVLYKLYLELEEFNTAKVHKDEYLSLVERAVDVDDRKAEAIEKVVYNDF